MRKWSADCAIFTTLNKSPPSISSLVCRICFIPIALSINLLPICFFRSLWDPTRTIQNQHMFFSFDLWCWLPLLLVMHFSISYALQEAGLCRQTCPRVVVLPATSPLEARCAITRRDG